MRAPPVTIKLRDYQREAIDDLRKRWDAGATRVPMVLATGLGKTVIFSTLIDEWLSDPENAGKRALVIAHTNELIEQAAASIKRVCPDVSVGIVKAEKNNVTARVVVSSRQTLASEKRRAQIRRVGLIVIDECHHAVSTNTYGKILTHFGALKGDETPVKFRHEVIERVSADRRAIESGGIVPDVKVAGFTATLARSDKMKLSTVWEDCTFKRDILFGIRNGYLLDVKGERVIVDDLNLRNVKTVGGDFGERSLADELERSFAIEKIAEQYARVASDRKGIAFWPLVATAEHAAEVFSKAGIKSAVVHGAMDKTARRQALADLRSGAIQVIHNAMVLTEGFDDPSVECIVMGRPTKSAPLYQQCVGRALRPDLTIEPSARRPALVIDVTGASEGNDLRSLIDLSPERVSQGTYDEHPDATLSELEEIYALEIEEEIGQQRAGASFEFESDEYSGATTTRTFDPLGRTKVWGKTAGGTYYTKASVYGKADAFVFIVDSITGDPGTYDIVRCSINHGYNPQYDAAPEWAAGTEHVGLRLDMALAWGEDLAGDAFSTRKSAWRNKVASQGLKNMARYLGVTFDEFVTAGDLSEAVDAAKANRRIDPLVALVRSRMQQSNA